jgi:hypothetical protein
MRALRRPILLSLLIGIAAAGCGRREEPGALDAKSAPGAAGVVSEKPLPATALQVRWGPLAFPRTVAPNTTIPVTVKVTNTGNAPWPDKASASPKKDGSYAVRVTHAFVRAGDAKDGRIGALRTDLLRPVMPGDTVDVTLNILTPTAPGDYNLSIELVQELVQWFTDRGADRIIQPVHVAAAGEGAAGTTASPPARSPKAAGRQ